MENVLFSETSDNQLLVDMSLHPSPLEELDPLSFEIKKEDIKQEIDDKFDDCVKQYPNIVIKEEVDLDNIHDLSYEVMPTKYNGDEDHKVKHTDLEQCTSEVISEPSSTLKVNDCTYICSVCEKNDDVPKHIIADNYRCDECNETFSHKLEIQTHFERVHGKYKEIIDLNGCVMDTGVRCSNSNIGINKQYKCGLCKQSFFQIRNVKNNERIHTGNKPYTCHFCKKSFTRFGILKVHERIHTGNKPYKCSFCAKSFFQLSNLKVHERIHTGIKPYKCGFCAESFSQSNTLKIHELIHTGSKRFMCSFCGKLCTHSSALRIHERTHTGNKPYKCSYCEKLFAQLKSVKRHQLSHIGFFL